MHIQINQVYLNVHEISRASTNAHSNKPSLSSSKNSGKNNNSNVDNININQINEEENINETSFELINQYTSIIMKNSESIKKLQIQVNKLEKNIIEIINELEKEENENNCKKKINKKKEEKNIIKDKGIGIDNSKNNNNDISNYGDVSINVPRIIYKELSITKDDL